MNVRDVPSGVELSLYAWGENEEAPADPQLRFVDVNRKHTVGTLGMFINQGSPASVAVRHYQAAVPEPSLLSLAILAFVTRIRDIRRQKAFLR
ncbi:MAG: hypothetical protein R3E01_03345 [Pirellulaceae bacterium]